MVFLLLFAALLAPSSASAGGTVTGSAAPNATITATATTPAGQQASHVQADAAGHYRFKVPLVASAVDFLQAGQPPAHLTVKPAPHGTVAFSFATVPTAFQRGEIAALSVNGFRPLDAVVRVDGRAAGVSIAAASDLSVLLQLDDGLPRGAHSLTLASGGVALTARVYLVNAAVSVGPPAQLHVNRPVLFTADGLENEPAKVELTLTGNAVFANGKTQVELPVEQGKAQTTMRADSATGVNLRWHLDLAPRYALGYNLAEIPTEPSPTPGPPCHAELTDGAFEAMQGPYQDDPVFTNKPEQLVREDGPAISYFGHLDLIKDRPTLLVGVDHYARNGVIVPVDSRDRIFMKGTTNCSEAVGVKLRFKLYERGSAPRLLYTSPVLTYVSLRGSGKARRVPWEASLNAYSGVPATPFTLTSGANFYAIKAELVDIHDRETGLSMWLNGYTSVTTGPSIRFLPIVLSHSPNPNSFADRSAALLVEAHRLRQQSYDYIPDVYPLAPRGLPMPTVAEPIDLTGSVLDTKFGDFLRFDISIKDRYQQNLEAALADRLSATTAIEGASRTVAVLSDGDFTALVGDYATGTTLTTKLVVVRWTRNWPTVAHEIAHTLPEFLWSVDQMVAQCDKNYHNEDGTFAYGMQLTRANAIIPPEHREGYPRDIMQGNSSDAWISQCTYDNLTGALKVATDPIVLLARFYLAQPVHGGVVASFKPSYEVAGTPSRTQGGTFSLIALDAAGNEVRRVRFEPQWSDDNGVIHHIITVQLRIPYSATIARLEVRRDAALLASMAMSTVAPTVRIDSARIAANLLHLRWSGRTERGRSASYTVWTSRDGKHFDERLFEVAVTQAALPVLRGRRPVAVRVTIDDGSRNAQTTARLR